MAAAVAAAAAVSASESCVLAPVVVVVSGSCGVASDTGSGVGLLMTPPGDDEAGDVVGLRPGDDGLLMTKLSARRRSADLDAWLGLRVRGRVTGFE